jgi:hypothetical protein
MSATENYSAFEEQLLECYWAWVETGDLTGRSAQLRIMKPTNIKGQAGTTSLLHTMARKSLE